MTTTPKGLATHPHDNYIVPRLVPCVKYIIPVPFTAVLILFLPVDAVLASPQEQDIQETRGAVSGFGGFAVGQGDGLDNGPTFGGSGRVFFTRNIGVEGLVQYDSLDLDGNTSNDLSGGTIDTVSVTGGIVARFPASPKVAPYVTGGVTFFSTSFEVSPAVVSELGNFNFVPEEDIDSTVGFSLGGGVDALLTRKLGIFGDVRFTGGTADTTVRLRDTVSGTTSDALTGEQELNRVTVVAGLRVFF